jgi:hypothetical protein
MLGSGTFDVKCAAVAFIRRSRPPAEDDADHELERYMRCKLCSEERGYPHKRSHLVKAAVLRLQVDGLTLGDRCRGKTAEAKSFIFWFSV